MRSRAKQERALQLFARCLSSDATSIRALQGDTPEEEVPHGGVAGLTECALVGLVVGDVAATEAQAATVSSASARRMSDAQQESKRDEKDAPIDQPDLPAAAEVKTNEEAVPEPDGDDAAGAAVVAEEKVRMVSGVRL
jgi:hypothetical protein